MKSYLALAMWSLFGWSLPAQQVWKVACGGGPGVHFTDLPPAVAAAAPGDTILLIKGVAGLPYPACQPPYTATTISKGIHIVAFQLVPNPPVSAIDLRVAVEGLIIVEGIPANERFTMTQIATPNPTFLPPVSQRGVIVRDCAGEVIIEDYSNLTGFVYGSTVEIVRSPRVTLRGCEMYMGGAPVLIEDSSVFLTNVAVRHMPPYPLIAGGYPEQTVPGIRSIRSTVTTAGSLIEGYSGPWGSSGPGASLDQSIFHVGPETRFAGALPGGVPGAGLGIRFDPSPVGSQVYVDPRATVVSAQIVPPFSSLRRSTTYHSWITPGDYYGLRHLGPPGGFSLMVFGDLLPTPIPSPFGNLAFDPFTATAVDLVALAPADGSYLWGGLCPTGVPVGRPFVFQALTLATDGTFGVSDPSPVLVFWQPNLLP
jgi:hypothetical protein